MFSFDDLEGRLVNRNRHADEAKRKWRENDTEKHKTLGANDLMQLHSNTLI
jgi:hypothetical protein